MLHYYVEMVGSSYLALRLPSILASIVTALLAFQFVRRQFGVNAGAFTACFVLETLSPFSLQVRPYTIIVACFAISLLLWNDLASSSARWRLVLIAFSLSTAVAFHFYGVLFVPCFGIIEIVRILRTRQVRLGIWIALVIAGASIFLWSSIMRATSHYIADDVGGSYAYRPAPTLRLLLTNYLYLSCFGLNGGVVCILLITFILGLSGRMTFLRKNRGSSPSVSKQDSEGLCDFWNAAIGTATLPIMVFVFTLLVTKTYSLRHTIAASIGVSAIFSALLSRLPYFARMMPAILLGGAVWLIFLGVPQTPPFDHSAIYGSLPGPYPIVVADGSQFVQLEDSAPPEFRSRLVFLFTPPGVPIGDASDQHIIKRCTRVYPQLPVNDVAPFLAANPEFYVLDERTSDDTPATYLLQMHKIAVWKKISGAIIYRSISLTAAGQRQ